MQVRHSRNTWAAATGLLSLIALSPLALGQGTLPQQPDYRVAERPSSPLDRFIQGQPGEHPLMPAVRWAQAGLPNVQQIQDYTCTLVKRERVDGKLMPYQYMKMKIRHRPFSVYVKYLAPDDLKDREAIFIEGRNDGNLWGHSTGVQHKLIGTISLKPDGRFAMEGNRYPITEAGLLTLITRLLEIAIHDSQYGECNVNFIRGAKVNGRSCTLIEVVHPVPRRNFRFNLARVYVDDELNLPTRYEAYDWPKQNGEPPSLTEEYTYLDLKVNVGLTEDDFDINNPAYGFGR